MLKALILPHAGYVYSGPVAGTGYRCLAAERDAIRRVVLLGPSHRVAFAGVALSAHHAFASPLGEVAVDVPATAALLGLPGVQWLEAAHADEHALEVHLPFLQMALAEFLLVPLVVGAASVATLSTVIEQLWDGPQTRIIVSSDLSHYHEYALARQLDGATAACIEKLQPLASAQACGAMPVNGLLDVARHHRLTAHTLDLRNSGDTAGHRASVVGYGAFALCASG